MIALAALLRRSLRRQPSVGLAACIKTYHISLQYVSCLHLIKPRLTGLRLQRIHIDIRLGMKDHPLSRPIDIVRQKRGISQIVDGIGDKNGELRPQGKIGFPDIKSHHHGLYAVLFTIITRALFPGPEKSHAPLGYIIHLCLIDAHRKRGYPLRQITVCNGEHNPLRRADGIFGIRKYQPASVRLTGRDVSIIDTHTAVVLRKSRIAACFGQAHARGRLICFLNISVSLSDQHRLYPVGLPGHRISDIIPGQRVSGPGSRKTH